MSFNSKAQLSAGDIAFIGYVTDNQSWAFIALTDIPGGEQIYFTDKGWTGAAWMSSSDDHLLYTTPAGGLSCGEIITCQETSADIFSATTGTLVLSSGSGWNLVSGDQILAYQSTTGPEPVTPDFIAGVHGDYNASDYNVVTTWNTGATSNLQRSAVPSGLTNGVNCVSLYPAPGPELDNAKYNGTLTGAATVLRSMINNPANWISDDLTSYPINPGDFPAPSVACSSPTSPKDWCWVESASSNNTELGADIASDTANNWIYTVGYWQGGLSATFGADFTTSTSGSRDAFVAKYDMSGTLLWAFPLGGTGIDECRGVDVDASGNIYVSGIFEFTVDFAGETGPSTPLASTGSSVDAFLAKYDSDGQLIWVRQSGSVNDEEGEKVCVNTNGVFMSGRYQTGATFGGENTVTSAGGWDCFFVGYDHSGTKLWLADAGTAGNDRAKGIVAGPMNVFAIGQFQGAAFSGNDGLDSPFSTAAVDAAEADVFIVAFDEASGNDVWIHTIGSDDIDLGYDIDIDANGLYCTGISNTNTNFPGFGNLATQNFGDPFVSRHNKSDGLCTWAIGEPGSGSSDYGLAIKSNKISTLYVGMQIQGTTVFGGGSQTIASAGVGDIVIAEYSTLTGLFNGATQAGDEDNEYPLGLSTGGDSSVFFTGQFVDDSDFPPIAPTPTLSTAFANFNYLVGNIGCAPCTGPDITACQSDVNVLADATCNHTIGDYTGGLTVTDNCGSGITVTQNPVPGTVLAAGEHQIEMVATDGDSKTDTCYFTLTIEADINPTVVQCGDLFVGETTLGSVNNEGSFACSAVLTPGEDKYYQITVPAGNYLLGVAMRNVADVSDTDVKTFWVGSTCPVGGVCLSEDNFNIADQDFDSNNQEQILLNAVGPGTFWFVVDSETDGIDSYDIEFSCIISGIEFDESGCGPDSDNDGIYTTVDGSDILEVEPCESVTICNELYIKNENGGEWFDTLVMSLGPCYTNITNTVPDAPGPNGFYNAGGTWNAVVDAPANEIEWGFDHSTANLWGDGVGTNYNCRTYVFCFDTDISASCADEDSLDIAMLITDDGVDGLVAWSVAGFDGAVQDGFTLLPPDPGFVYGATTYCVNDPDPAPSIDSTGGTFSASPAGLSINATTGLIDLSASTPNTYDITYSIGFCPEDSVFQINVVGLDVVNTFQYPSSTICQYDTDPSPILGVGTTAGGTYSATPAGLSINSTTGVIDADISTPGAYTVKYLTPGTCPDSITTAVTIVAPDVVNTFTYGAGPFCQNGTDPTPNLGAGTTPGGTFTASPGGLSINPTTGVVDLSASSAGGPYTIKYVTPGTCPDSVTTSMVISTSDVVNTLDYGAGPFCQSGSDASPTLGAGTTPGGTYSSTPAGLSINSSTGVVDVSASTAGGPYTVKYLTSGICPDSVTTTITITADDVATSISYSSSTYCQYDADPSPTLGGGTTPGGTYTATPAGLSINSTTGIVDLSASTAGLYTIKYVTSGLCPDSVTTTMTVNADDVVNTFDYGAAPFCNDEADLSPNLGAGTTAGGTFSSTPAGLSLNPTTGDIDVSASTTGTLFTVKYVTPGICPDSITTTLTIEDADVVNTFTYPSPDFCPDDTDPLPGFGLGTTGGGTFSATPAGLTINTSTGVVDLDASSPGIYTIKYVTPGACPDSVTTTMTINTPDVATSITYPAPPLCQSGPDVTPTLGGGDTPGGLFTATPAGLSIDALSGEIDVSASTPGGPYTIKYLTLGPCPDSVTTTVIIEADDVITSFDYGGPVTFCENGIDPSPVLGAGTTLGGTYSAPPAVSIDGVTGIIDLSASTSGGPYIIKYLTSGVCPDSLTIDITITPTDSAGFDYGGTTTFCLDSSTIVAVPEALTVGGGTYSSSPSLGASLNTTTGAIDLESPASAGTYWIYYTTPAVGCQHTDSIELTFTAEDTGVFTYSAATYCQNELTDPAAIPSINQTPGGSYSASPAGLVINAVDGTIDLSASADGSYIVKYLTTGSCPDSMELSITINPIDSAGFDYGGSTTFCLDSSTIVPVPEALTVAGGTYTSSPSLGAALNASTGEIDLETPAVAGTYWIYYTTPAAGCQNTDSIELTFTAEDTASFAYIDVAFCQNDPFDPAAIPAANQTPGGTYSASPAGMTINPVDGTIDLSASADGTYSIKYLTTGPCPDSSEISITINPTDSAGFDYGGTTTFCLDSSTIAVTYEAPTITGGFFTSFPSGIDLNLITGEINLVTPTDPGTYMIYYTTPVGGCQNTDSIELTFNAEDTSLFEYPGSASYCKNGSDVLPVPLSAGFTSGGTYSSTPAGLDLNSSTGLITVSTSTAGTYTVKYLTMGVCPDSTEFVVEILDTADASFDYGATSFCLDGLTADTLVVGESGGTFSAEPGVTIDPASGQIDLSTAFTTAGTYWIYYETSPAGCQHKDSLQFTFNELDDPFFAYDEPYCATEGSNPIPTGLVSTGTFSEVSATVIFADPATGEIDITLTPFGAYNIKFVTDGVCPDSLEQDITIYGELDTTFWVPDTICLDYPIINLSDSTTVEIWETHFFEGAGVSLSGTDFEEFDPVATGPGIFDILHIISNPACSDTMTLTVEIFPGYEADHTIPDTLCEAAAVYNLNDYFDVSTDPGGIWNGTGVSMDSIWTVSGLAGNTYPLEYIVGAGICADSVTSLVYVANDVDTSWTIPGLMCESGDTVDLDLLITGDTGGTFSGTGVSANKFIPSDAGAGEHEVTYTVGATGCEESLMDTITVLEDPYAYAGSDAELCDQEHTMNAVSNLGSGIWTSSRPASYSDSSLTDALVTVDDYGWYTFYWTVDQSGLCQATDSVVVVFYEQPTADAGPDQELSNYTETNLEAVVPTAGSGSWSVLSGSGDFLLDTDPTTLVTGLSTGENVFEWAVENGVCPIAYDEVIITVKEMLIPEAITPNGDGKNDLFAIYGIEEIENNLKIYNRWGQLIYEADNYQNDWGGEDMSGDPLNPDTYYYILTLNGNERFNGYVVLKRN